MNSADAYYYGIKGLTVPGQTVFAELDNSINNFIDKIERCTDQLEISLSNQNLREFTKHLGNIQEMLRLVYAKGLEADGNALIRTAQNEGLENCRPLVRSFTTNLKSLSIEMQKAQSNIMRKDHAGSITKIGGGETGALKTVLAVDDRPEILTTVAAALKGHYKVLGAPGGSAALQIIKQQSIDLFILDIDMPGMDGFELTERIRAESKYADTPIMFLTATSSRERIKRSMELGIWDFIVKPAYNETLLDKVGNYFI